MNAPTTDSCADKNWLECKNKVDEILKLLDGLRVQDAKHVLDSVNAELWNNAVVRRNTDNE